MLCCIGLIGGAAVGQYLGGPWTAIGPVAGFGIGLVADMKLGTCFHKKERRPDAAVAAKKSTDPVCGMAVDERPGQYHVEHLGRTYYFCAAGCKKSFEEDPEKYLGKVAEAA